MQSPDASFIVYTDLHIDIMHDSIARMEVLLREAKRLHVDFIVHLGDIVYPDSAFIEEHSPDSIIKRKENPHFLNDRDDEKQMYFSMIERSGIPSFGVLGNHEMDSCGKIAAWQYLKMPGRYHKFDCNGIRFIALDTNNIKHKGKYLDYDHGNYFKHEPHEINWIDGEQLKWLEDQVMSSPYPCVLMSHAPIVQFVPNAEDIYALIRRANNGHRKVILAMAGHTHVDGLCIQEGVPFWDVNSISNQWLGKEYATVRYSQTISQVYPHMRFITPFWDALFAHVTIDGEGIHIKGRETSYVGPSPQELFAPYGTYPMSPIIESRFLPLNG